MPACWEQKGGVMVCVLAGRDMVAAQWADAWRNLIFPERSILTKPGGLPWDHARNTACDFALSQDVSHLFFLDDDVIAPPDAILRLLAHGKDIVSGVYYRRSPPIGVPVMMRFRPDGQTEYVTDYSWPALIPVDLVGAGCLLISRRVLEVMKAKGGHHPWFDWRSDRLDLPPNQRFSEDFTFCVRAKREFGFEILVDTSVQCRHVGMAQAFVDGTQPVFMPL